MTSDGVDQGSSDFQRSEFFQMEDVLSGRNRTEGSERFSEMNFITNHHRISNYGPRFS